MAKRQVVSYSYTCDVCEGTIPDSDGEGATRKVSWEGTDYVVDVCAMHSSQLGEILSRLKGFVDAGQRESGRRGRRALGAGTAAAPKAPRGRPAAAAKSTSGTAPKRGDLGAIRAWARENGHKINERGRIPGALLAAYDAANNPATTPEPAPEPESAASAPRKRGPRKSVPATS